MEKINLAEGLMAQMMEEEAWKDLSGRCNENLLTVEIVERFKDYFDWKELSGHCHIPLSIIDRFPDLIDWKELIRSYHHDEIHTRAFFEKYKEYIPVSSFKDSVLWNNIVNDIRKDIERRLRGGDI